MTYKLSEIRKGIAESEKTPPAILEKLALQLFGEGEKVIIYLLSQMLPNATSHLLEALEKYTKNHPSPENILFYLQVGCYEELISDWRKLWDEISEEDAKNIEILVGDGTKKPINQKFLEKHPEADSLYNFMKNFAKKLEEGRRNIRIGISLLGNPSTPKKLRERLFKQLQSLLEGQKYYSEQDIYLALAFNSAIPREERNEYFQQVIVKGGSRTLAKSSQTPSEVLAILPINKTRNELAENPHTPPDILRQLAQEKSSYTRSYVAKNPSTPTDILVELINETDSKLTLEKRLNCPYRNYEDWKGFIFDYPRMPKLELYRILLAKEIEEETTEAKNIITYSCIDIPALQPYVIEHGDRSARIKMAKLWRTPLHLLERLITDPDPKVRAQVAENQNLPWYLLLQLTKDEDINVRKKLVRYTHYKHEQTPVEILEAFTNDESEEIRALVAGKDYTPGYILSQLANDTSLKVKEKVVSNLNTPVEVLDRLWRENGIFDLRNPNTPGHVLAEAIAQTNRSEDLCKLLDNSVKGSQMPASILENLASHKDRSVRSCVAEHPNTPGSVLAKLADEEHWTIHWDLALNPNTPPHILEELLSKWGEVKGKTDEGLCCRIAKRRDAPAVVLEYLAESESEEIRQAVADNPSTPVSALVQLAVTESQECVLRALSKNPSLDAEVAEKLAQRPEPEVRLYAIDNPHITLEIWQKLARDESAKVREAIAVYSNSVTTLVLTTTYRDIIPRIITSKYRYLSPELHEDFLQEFLNGDTISTTVIQHPHLPLELWQELATDSEVKVRQGAAINPDAPISILELLAVDENSEVRRKLVYNSNLPINILKRLGMDISAAVREVVAKSDRAPIKLLEQLALDEKREIMQALIDNPNTPASVRQSLRYRLRTKISPTLRGLSRLYEPETDDLATILSEYVTSSVPFVRLVSLMHPLTPIPCLEVGAKSTFWWERYAVTVNPATPVELRQKLAEDSHHLVKVAALNSRLG